MTTSVRKWGSAALACAVGALVASCSSSEGSDAGDGTGGMTVCADQYVSANDTQAVIDGLRSVLDEAPGGAPQLKVKNPEADAGTQQTIVQQYLNDDCDVLVPVATAGAQAYAAATDNIPIVFIGVSTPVQAKLVESMDEPGGNVTGVADVLPIEEETDAMLKVDPSIKKIGLIWKTGDAAGDYQASVAIDHIEELGLEAITANIATAADVTTAATSLVGRDVDAIQLPCDGTVLGAVPGIVKVATDAGIPVFGCTGGSVEEGVILAGAYDYRAVGEEAGKLVLKVLDGADPADTAVVIPPIGGFAINETQAKKLNLTIPADLLDSATVTY